MRHIRSTELRRSLLHSCANTDHHSELYEDATQAEILFRRILGGLDPKHHKSLCWKAYVKTHNESYIDSSSKRTSDVGATARHHRPGCQEFCFSHMSVLHECRGFEEKFSIVYILVYIYIYIHNYIYIVLLSFNSWCPGQNNEEDFPCSVAWT